MTPGSALATPKSVLMTRIANCASWFIWIAGVSLVNSLCAMTGSARHFFLGLGLTQLIDFIPKSATGHAIAFGCDLFVSGTWVLLYWQGKKGKTWSFIIGVIFLVMDTLLLVIFKEWLSAAIHVFVVAQIFVGIRASSELRRVETAERQQAAAQIGYAPAPGVWPPPPGGAPGSWPPAQSQNAAPGAWPPAQSPGYAPGAWPPPQDAAPPPGAWPPPQAQGAYVGESPAPDAPGTTLNDPPPPEKRY